MSVVGRRSTQFHAHLSLAVAPKDLTPLQQLLDECDQARVMALDEFLDDEYVPTSWHDCTQGGRRSSRAFDMPRF
jgi:hypothetical protein